MSFDLARNLLKDTKRLICDRREINFWHGRCARSADVPFQRYVFMLNVR
jgi:hypothetical protein